MTNPYAAQLVFDKPGRGRVYGSILETIGNTPLVRIGRFAQEAGCQAEVLAKLEFFNPTSSLADRVAFSAIRAMEWEGQLNPGSVIVEPVYDDAGIGLAFACAAKGYRCILTMPDGLPLELRQLIRFLGAELVLTPREKGIGGAIEKAKEIIATSNRAVMPWQFGHPANPEIHRRTTAEEIWRDTNGVIDAVVLGVRSGGTLTGVGDVLKARNGEIRIIAVELENSPVLSAGTGRQHTAQGIGSSLAPEVLETKLIDEVILVKNHEAIDTARRLALLEGIPAGISAGLALAGAVCVAKRDEMKGRTIVTVLPDCAERHLSTVTFEAFRDA